MYNVLYRAFRILCEYFDRGCMTYLSKGLLLTKSVWEVVHVIWYAIRSEFSLLFSAWALYAIFKSANSVSSSGMHTYSNIHL